MKDLPLVTILTVTNNSEKTIKRAIESVLNQTYSCIEYIIVDNLSKDKTIENANEYVSMFEEKNYVYKIISEADKGMYDALNKGAQIATGDIVGQINSDDWYEANAVSEIVNLFETTNCDMGYADIRMIAGDGSSWIKKAKVDKFVNTRHWNHPTQFVKRKLLIEHPYQCKCMSDDLDFMLWVRRNKYKVSTLNKVIANFTLSGMSHTKSFKDINNRIYTKTKIYLQNGYSLLHFFDVFVIEWGKFILELKK